jgi:hypothetical protein
MFFFCAVCAGIPISIFSNSHRGFNHYSTVHNIESPHCPSLVVYLCFRLRRLKQNDKPYRAFFSSDNNYRPAQSRGPGNFPRTTGLPPPLPGQPYPEPFLTGFPPAYIGHRTRRTRAADIGAGGRRIATAEFDHDGELGDKDALPAYDSYGGPPKYFELEMQTRLFGSGSASRPPLEQCANRPNHVDILLDPRSSPNARQESPCETPDTPPDPPQSSDVDPMNYPPINSANGATSPRERANRTQPTIDTHHIFLVDA